MLPDAMSHEHKAWMRLAMEEAELHAATRATTPGSVA